VCATPRRKQDWGRGWRRVNTLNSTDISTLRTKTAAWQRGPTKSIHQPYEFRGGPLDGLRLMLGLGHDPEHLAIAHLLHDGIVQVLYHRMEGRVWTFAGAMGPPAVAGPARTAPVPEP
jgi:hypothetical protein